MRYLKQFFVIIIFSFAGELLHYIIPLPVPASIYGMILLFAALCLKFVKLDMVRETGKFLIKIMPVMFLPAAVGIMEQWGVLKPVLLPVIVIMVVSLVVVMGVSASVTQSVKRAGIKHDMIRRREANAGHTPSIGYEANADLAPDMDGGEKDA